MVIDGNIVHILDSSLRLDKITGIRTNAEYTLDNIKYKGDEYKPERRYLQSIREHRLVFNSIGKHSSLSLENRYSMTYEKCLYSYTHGNIKYTINIQVYFSVYGSEYTEIIEIPKEGPLDYDNIFLEVERERKKLQLEYANRLFGQLEAKKYI